VEALQDNKFAVRRVLLVPEKKEVQVGDALGMKSTLDYSAAYAARARTSSGPSQLVRSRCAPNPSIRAEYIGEDTVLGVADFGYRRVNADSDGTSEVIETWYAPKLSCFPLKVDSQLKDASGAVILMDEASTGLDPAARRDLTRHIGELRDREGVTILLTTDAAIRRLNRKFRGKNKATDVLSFPAGPLPGLKPSQQPAGDLADGQVHLAVGILEDPQPGHLAGDPVEVLDGVPAAQPHEDQQAAAQGRDGPALDGDPGLGGRDRAHDADIGKLQRGGQERGQLAFEVVNRLRAREHQRVRRDGGRGRSEEGGQHPGGFPRGFWQGDSFR